MEFGYQTGSGGILLDAMACSIPHAIAFGMCYVVCKAIPDGIPYVRAYHMPWLVSYHMLSIWYVVCKGIPHEHVVCFLAMLYDFWPCGMLFSQICVVHVVILHLWKPSCTTLDLQSSMALLGTQLMEYGPTHHTIIWFSCSTLSMRFSALALSLLGLKWLNVVGCAFFKSWKGFTKAWVEDTMSFTLLPVLGMVSKVRTTWNHYHVLTHILYKDKSLYVDGSHELERYGVSFVNAWLSNFMLLT